MNPDFAILMTFTTLYFLFALLVLWWAVQSIKFHINQAVNLIRQQHSENMRQLQENLLAAIRLQSASRR